MANALYTKARSDFAKGDIDWENDTFRVYVIDANDYTFSAAHEDLADVATNAKVANGTLASKTVLSTGACDAADTVITGVSGDPSEALIVARWTGTESTSTLICYLDTGTGLTWSPNGGDATVQWPASGIFLL